MVNLGDDARRYRIVGLKARPSYSGRHNMEETAHFLSKSTASPDPRPSREEARRGRPLRGSSASLDPREGVPPEPTLERGPPPSPEGPTRPAATGLQETGSAPGQKVVTGRGPRKPWTWPSHVPVRGTVGDGTARAARAETWLAHSA